MLGSLRQVLVGVFDCPGGYCCRCCACGVSGQSHVKCRTGHAPHTNHAVSLLVAVPKIAQQKLDDAELILDSLTVTHTQNQNLTITLASTIKTDGSVHADIDAFEGVLYLEDHEPHTPFAKVRFPQTTADALQKVTVNQFLPIEDVEALTIFNTWLLANQTLRVTVLGDTHVRVKGIARSYPVTFKKTISTPGTQQSPMGFLWLSRVLI